MNQFKKSIIATLLGVIGYSQQVVVVNTGQMAVEDKTLVSVYANFINNPKAQVFNDGQWHQMGNFTNNGFFDYNIGQKNARITFRSVLPTAQIIDGLNESNFSNVTWDKSSPLYAFSVKAPLTVAHETLFANGIVRVESNQGGEYSFLKGSHYVGVSDQSYIDGPAVKQGDEPFTYPIGKQVMYRPASISAPTGEQVRYQAEYFFENSNNPNRPHLKRSSTLKFIDDKEYWIIEPQNENTPVLVTLSWDERTTPKILYASQAKGLRIVLWDEQKKRWIDQGGIVNWQERTITTPIQMDKFGYFTLGVLKDELIEDVDIYNGITVNNDGDNDYFHIDSVFFKERKLKVYNRWGVLVYESNNKYGEDDEVFRGFSQNKLTVNNKFKLPAGVYYYVFEYRKDKNDALRTKVGWVVVKTQ